MASDVVKGGWAPEEDERLVKGIERYGTRYARRHLIRSQFLTSHNRWSLVASVVQTRNSDRRFPFPIVSSSVANLLSKNVPSAGQIPSILLSIGQHGLLKL